MARPKLLLADDSVTIRKVVELTFADEGIDVTAVSDSDSAMQTFVEIEPDIVLVDIGLPGTNGYQICEMIKQDEGTSQIPVLLLVGSFEPFDQDEAERVNADGYLTKPFHSIRDLVTRVRDLIGTEEDVQEAPAEDTPDRANIPEVDDIESLYNDSFATTTKIEDYDTRDDLLGDAAMDDEMIEASYPSPNGSGELTEEFPFGGETTKEFDWSPESLITESLATPAAVEDPVEDDPFEGQEPDEAVSANTESEEMVTDISNETTKQFDWSPDAVVTDLETGKGRPAPVYDNVSFGDFRAAEQISEPDDSEMPVVLERVTDDPEYTGPSAEFIALVAERVIERLSDQVIREIAKEAVPRIAEQLIREALDEDKRT